MTGCLGDGIKFFNEARFFEAHEAWEDLWRDDRSDLRQFYQGLIQAAVGLHHLTHRNLDGAQRQLAKSLAKLDLFPAGTAGIDVGQLRRELRKVLDHMDLESLPAVRIVLESEGTF